MEIKGVILIIIMEKIIGIIMVIFKVIVEIK